MKRIRNKRAKLTLTKDGRYSVSDVSNGESIFKSNEDYYIYMKSVNFNSDGEINGRLLGYAEDLYIGSNCESVAYDVEKGYTLDGKQLRKARMVAIRNGDNAIVVIQSV